MRFKRNQRCTCSLAATAAVAAAAVFTSVVAGELPRDADAEIIEHHHGDEHQVDPPSLYDPERPHATHFRRRLARSAAAAFDAWTPDRAARAVPLDLLLDGGGEAYLAGTNGYIEPYKEAFGQRGSHYWAAIRKVDDIMKGPRDREDVHVLAPHRSAGSRVHNELLEDGIDPAGRKGLRGRQRNVFHQRALQEGGIIHLDSLEFKAAHEEEEPYAPQEGEVEDEEEEDDDEEEEEESLGRSLRSLPHDSTPRRTLKKKKKKNQQKKKKLPKIDRLVPSQNSIIQEKQTFSARVRRSDLTRSDIKKVSFELEDEEGSTSGWLSVPKVGDYYEITVEGFGEYPGSKWKYTIRAEDDDGKQKTSTVKAIVATSSTKATPAPSPPAKPRPAPSPPAKPRPAPSTSAKAMAPPAPSPPAPPRASPLPQTKVEESEWPHAGAVRTATGRIMFEFNDGTDLSFVCSGTVVMDGRDGQRPDDENGRTIIQTAAHCAYSDVLKQFASRAVFIPDQASTRGEASNFDCGDDIYGCWYLSFAVVAKGWAEGNFPDNVPFDYAYYTVFDGRSTHSGGYRQGLTGVLDRDVTPMALDFDADPRGEFIVSIGYSADKDPSLRHCSQTNTDIHGLSWYANLWLDDCGMTGGASGGPWLVDMDNNGVGTLISVSSWGFTDQPGMAGPVLRTRDGSVAECLYEKAKSARDPGNVGGIIVNNC